MKRLKHKLMHMELNTATYTEMYDASMTEADPATPWLPSVKTADPTYYNGDIGFGITGTHKLAQDKPTVTVIIPNDYIWRKI